MGVSPARAFEALVDATALVDWLSPEGALGSIDAMDAREGGGFRLRLLVDDAAQAAEGDVTHVEFAELEAPRRAVWRVAFETDDERFSGPMRMTWELVPVEAGTRITVAATDVPAGVEQREHELGLGRSLARLAALLG